MRVCLPDAACKAAVAAAGRQLPAHACRGQERGRAGPPPRRPLPRRLHAPGMQRRQKAFAQGFGRGGQSPPRFQGELIVSRASLADQRQKPLGGLHAQSCRRLAARPARGRFFFWRAAAGPSSSPPLFALARHAGALTARPTPASAASYTGHAVRRPRLLQKRRARRGICSQMRELWPAFRAAASARAAARPADSWRQRISHPIKFLPALLHASSTPYPPAAGSRTFPLFVVTHSIRRR